MRTGTKADLRSAAHSWHGHKPGGMPTLLSGRTSVTLTARQHHRSLADTKLYSDTCMWTTCRELLRLSL